MNFKNIAVLVCVSLVANSVWAQANKKPQMQFLGAFDSGQAGVNIYKMFDSPENVICYILMPEVVGRKPADTAGEKWIYDGNSIGSISCVKTSVNVSVGMHRDLIDLDNSLKNSKKNNLK